MFGLVLEANHTCEEDSNFKGPPFYTDHQQSKNTKAEENAPFLQAFLIPALKNIMIHI